MAIEVGLFFELLDVVTVAARVDLPVEPCEIVAGKVLAVLGELYAEALERAAVQTRQKSFDHRPRLQLHRPEPRQHGWIEKPEVPRFGGRGHRHMPLRGTGTDSSRRS